MIYCIGHLITDKDIHILKPDSKKNRFLNHSKYPNNSNKVGSKATGDYKDINLNFRFNQDGLGRMHDELLQLLEDHENGQRDDFDVNRDTVQAIADVNVGALSESENTDSSMDGKNPRVSEPCGRFSQSFFDCGDNEGAEKQRDSIKTGSIANSFHDNRSNNCHLKARYKIGEDEKFLSRKDLESLLRMSYLVCELQIHHRDIKNLKCQQGHTDYVHFRNLIG